MTTKADRPSGVRVASVVVGTMALAGALFWWFARTAWSGWHALRSGVATSAPDLLVAATAAIGLVVLLWLAVAVLAATASTLPGRGTLVANRLATVFSSRRRHTR